MSETARLRSLLDSAERAAAAGYFPAARQLLEEAVTLQEVELGPAHPDLANTLNNLGVLCERTDNAAEAERCYRRACAIAEAAFPPGHPFVETSRRNLAEFCAVRGIPVDAARPAEPMAPAVALFPSESAPAEPAATPARTEPRPAPAAPRPQPARPESGTRPAAARPLARPAPLEREPLDPVRRRSRGLALLVTAGVVILVIAAGLWFRRGTIAEATPNPSDEVPAAAATPQPPPAPVTSARPPGRSGSAGVTPAAPPARALTPQPFPTASANVPASSPSAGAAAMPAPTVVDARLCATLDTGGAEWTCAPLADPAGAGPVYFYTRLRTGRDMTIRHRWYLNGHLQMSRDLQIRVNLGPGYRTYTQYTLSERSRGQWRVELATPDGQVLHEEQFVVR
jgi:Protein of unknown function (DUF2914)/Tetratricopeptide repeat